MLFVLLLVIYIGGVPPVLAVEVHDFKTKQGCEQAATLIQAMVRTELKTGGKVVWRCVEADPPDRTRVGWSEGVPAPRQHSL